MTDIQGVCSFILNLISEGKLSEAQPVIEKYLAEYPEDADVCYVYGIYLLNSGNRDAAVLFMEKAAGLNPNNINARIVSALHPRAFGPRELTDMYDKLLGIIRDFGAGVDSHILGDAVYRNAAERSIFAGERADAAMLWKRVAEKSGQADDYQMLSDACIKNDQMAEGGEALKKAAELDPQKYGKAYAEYLKNTSAAKPRTTAKQKRAMYPTTKTLGGDLKKLITTHLAGDLADCPKIMDDSTKIFTAGSCYSGLISRVLRRLGKHVDFVDLDQTAFTSHGTRALVDWLNGSLPPNDPMAQRIRSIVDPEITQEMIVDWIKGCDVFILTLGVAPSFFDRETGAFVIPPNTHIGTRALSESFKVRNTSVAENCSNIMYILSYVRSINPDVAIVVLVSPNPLYMTFEFNSAVAADCLSKSTLRVAAHEIVNNSGLKNIYYWPSLELYRWVSGHREPLFGVDDRASDHVSEAVMVAEMQCLTEIFGKISSI